MLWAGFALLTAVTAGLLLYPLWNPSRRQRRAAYDIEVYKAQLREVDAEAARGGLAADEAVAARLEIERRLLRVDKGQEAAPQLADGLKTDGSLMNFETGARRLLIPLVIAGVLFGAFLLYGRLGSPRMPDMPLEERELAAEEITPENVVGELTVLADKLAARMKSDPNDGDGWRLLGRTNQELGRYAAAAAAYARAAEVFPDEADLRAYEGENLVFEAKGTVTPRALRAFEAALGVDPGIPAAGYYVGLAHFQAGEFQQAYDRWLALGQTPLGPPRQVQGWGSTPLGAVLQCSLPFQPAARRTG
ncbi:MAG: c-type cytochrome biogenesis protein CcmI, partial [Rhodospirillales bacterium]|nr:c-type cytochrome biogenesis protein CcmI [Rhodospirillales bacterium]